MTMRFGRLGPDVSQATSSCRLGKRKEHIPSN
jgi:hypothetical protein